MIKLNSLSKLVAVIACLASCSVSNAQEAVNLQEDGSLAGKVFVAENATEAIDAKITLTQAGEVVATADTDEQGNFSFQNIEPGSYDMMGVADPYVGSGSFDVAPYSEGGCSSCSMGLSTQAPEAVYDTCGAAPAQAFSASPCGGGCNSCGGGLGGGRFGGGGGGGLLGPRPLLRLGVIGGIIGIAVSDDDASPAN